MSVAQLCEQQAFYVEHGAIPRELVENQQLSRAPTGEVAEGRGCAVGDPEYLKVPVLSVLTYPYTGPLFKTGPGTPIYASDGVENNAIAEGMVVYRTILPKPEGPTLDHLNPQTMD